MNITVKQNKRTLLRYKQRETNKTKTYNTKQTTKTHKRETLKTPREASGTMVRKTNKKKQ